MQSFNEIPMPESLRKAIEALKFQTPTPIQAQAIPMGLAGRDLLATAQTGSGKTVAFAIPLIVQAIKQPQSTALVLTPTRELATQIVEVFRNLTKFMPQIRLALLMGGAGMGGQRNSLLRRPSIIVATPGRLMDHIRRGNADLSQVTQVVLDEADRMLDMGFAPQIEEIFEFVPQKRQTILFSATLPKEILKLAQKYQTNPERITVGEVNRAAEKIKQSHIQVHGGDKNDKILEELTKRTYGSVLVFARTQIRTEKLARFLQGHGMSVAAIHGGRTQSQRNEALAGFRSLKYPVLVATDVAARGLDVPHIQTVINFDLPQTSEDYIHRIGRTARAGESGEAVSFVTPEETKHWRYLSGEKSPHKQGEKKSTYHVSQGPRSNSRGRNGGGRSRFSNSSRGDNSQSRGPGQWSGGSNQGGGRWSQGGQRSGEGQRFSPRQSSSRRSSQPRQASRAR